MRSDLRLSQQTNESDPQILQLEQLEAHVSSPLIARERESGSSVTEDQPPRPGDWINVVSHLDARYGGLSAVVPQLASAVARASDARVGISAFCAADEVYARCHVSEVALTTWPASRVAWLGNRDLSCAFRKQIAEADGVHIHGLWEQSTFMGAHTARALRKPYILSAHGMLERWALKNKRLKKAFYASLIEARNIRGAACLHALTHAEAQDYHRFGVKSPIAVIPNGVAVPAVLYPEAFLSKFPLLRGKKIVLFFGRIHFKKGLALLIEAWAKIARGWPEAHLVLAGPDFEGTRNSLETQIASRRLQNSVLFTGMLRDEAKWSALAAADCFILPSYSEGLSVSTLEAMAVELPVIVTEQCYLPEVAEFRAGWIIQPHAGQIAEAITAFLQNSKASNLEMGGNGRALVAQRYSWDIVGRQMSELYDWVQGGPLPGSVELLRNRAT